MPITLPEVYTISVGETELVSIDYSRHLDNGELLTGTPTVVEVTTSDLTLANKQVNTVAYVHQYGTAEIGWAVQFSVSGQMVANSPYTIRVTVSTDASIVRTFVRDIALKAV